MVLSIIILLLETLYCYIILKEFDILGKKNKIILFVSILAIIMLSGIVLNGSIFRYLFLPISFFIVIKLLNNRNSISFSCIILIALFIKYLIEFISVILLINNLDIYTISFIFEFISITFSLLFAKYVKNIKKIILKLWNSSKKFYIRYIFLICINIFILFIIHNLIQMKEVF